MEKIMKYTFLCMFDMVEKLLRYLLLLDTCLLDLKFNQEMLERRKNKINLLLKLPELRANPIFKL